MTIERMYGIEHIVSPMSAAWCGWTMLGLLLSAILGEVMQPGVITQAPTSLLAQADRTYKDAPVNLYGQLLISLFRIGTLGMGIYLCLPESAVFRFGIYAAICGLTFGMLLVKMLCNVLLDYTFGLSGYMDQTFEHYGDISTLATCVLYPALLVLLRIDSITASRWVLIIASGLFILMWTYRLIRSFMTNPKAILYIALYICTLEVLPLGALYFISSKIISL